MKSATCCSNSSLKTQLPSNLAFPPGNSSKRGSLFTVVPSVYTFSVRCAGNAHQVMGLTGPTILQDHKLLEWKEISLHLDFQFHNHKELSIRLLMIMLQRMQKVILTDFVNTVFHKVYAPSSKGPPLDKVKLLDDMRSVTQASRHTQQSYKTKSNQHDASVQ